MEIENQELRDSLDHMREQEQVHKCASNGKSYSAEVVDSLNVALAATCSSLAKLGDILLGTVGKMHRMVGLVMKNHSCKNGQSTFSFYLGLTYLSTTIRWPQTATLLP